MYDAQITVCPVGFFAPAKISSLGFYFNSLTPKCVPAGTKNSRLEDFLLAKHTSHKHPHHDELFSHLAEWF
jgi:hypothetical protein